ncbi:hypothetical protein ACN6MY_04945 [Peribacillus sp. B-H-3]|jgi:hypothetical protein|uniref:hypothetical protein n=1 Tax=Peribacillus sp. B-H-3 TaxID=3400420 RepID=UPI003B021ED3
MEKWTFDRLTTNEMKDLLTLYISPFKEMAIKANRKEHIKISKTKAINLLLTHLSKEQLNDLLVNLQYISKKNLNDCMYLQYILTGIVFNDLHNIKKEA